MSTNAMCFLLVCFLTACITCKVFPNDSEKRPLALTVDKIANDSEHGLITVSFTLSNIGDSIVTISKWSDTNTPTNILLLCREAGGKENWSELIDSSMLSYIEYSDMSLKPNENVHLSATYIMNVAVSNYELYGCLRQDTSVQTEILHIRVLSPASKPVDIRK